jgi:hypothetical protein
MAQNGVRFRHPPPSLARHAILEFCIASTPGSMKMVDSNVSSGPSLSNKGIDNRVRLSTPEAR